MVLCTVPGLCKFKPVQQKGKPQFQLQLIDTSNLQNEGNWIFASACGRIKNLSQSSEIPLYNRHNALGLKNEEHMTDIINKMSAMYS